MTLIRQEHKNLEIQLNSMKNQIQSQKPEEQTALTDHLQMEQSKYVLITEKCEIEERKNAELRDSLKRMEGEKNRYEKQLELAIEDQEKLVSSLALAEGVKEHLEIDLKRTKEELKSREEECEWLQKRIKTLTDALAKRQQQTSDEQTELKNLRRGMNNAREVMLDLEADMKQSKEQLTKVLEERTLLTQQVRNLTESENETTRKLQEAKEEEKRLKEVIADMTNDLQLSVKREMEMTEELQKERCSGEKNVPVKFVQKIKVSSINLASFNRSSATVIKLGNMAHQTAVQFRRKKCKKNFHIACS